MIWTLYSLAFFRCLSVTIWKFPAGLLYPLTGLAVFILLSIPCNMLYQLIHLVVIGIL